MKYDHVEFPPHLAARLLDAVVPGGDGGHLPGAGRHEVAAVEQDGQPLPRVAAKKPRNFPARIFFFLAKKVSLLKIHAPKGHPLHQGWHGQSFHFFCWAFDFAANISPRGGETSTGKDFFSSSRGGLFPDIRVPPFYLSLSLPSLCD